MRSEVSRIPYHISDVIRDINNEKLCFDHPCQRKVGRWNEKQELRLIDSILQKYPIPNIYILNEEETKRTHSHTIIDGNQRLHTIRMYFDPNSTTTWNFNHENVPSNCLWLANILVAPKENSIDIYYLQQNQTKNCFRIKYKNNVEEASAEEITDYNLNNFSKPSYGQLTKIETILNDISMRGETPSSLFSVFSELTANMGKWSRIISNVEIGVTYVFLDKGENENKILSEIFDRLNYGRTPKPAELINNLCYHDKLWNVSSDFAKKISIDDKKATYGYNPSVSFSESKLFPEFQSNDRSDELFWGELFFSVYTYTVFNKDHMPRKGNSVIPYYIWNVELIRTGYRCIELKKSEVNKIENIDESLMNEIVPKMSLAFNLAKELCRYISPQERHKKILASVVLYSFYLVSKYTDPLSKLTHTLPVSKLKEVLRSITITRNKQYEEINQKTNALIKLCGI